jgi:Ca2+-binding EF-hand superfamily protein
MNEKISEENEILEFINIFQGFDREGNGMLSRKTMFDVFAITNVDVDKQLVNDMFDFIDNDKDDHITCLEFVQFWIKHGTSNN